MTLVTRGEDLLAAITDRAFIGDDDLPRTQKAFEAQLKRARTRLPAVSEGACRLLAAIGVEYHQLSLALGAAKGPLARPAAEIKSQIKYLIYKEKLPNVQKKRIFFSPPHIHI